VDCRVAIGRSYYALFNAAARFLRDNHCDIPNNPEADGKVFQYLCDISSDEDLRDVGGWIRDNRGKRNEADYDLKSTRVERSKDALSFVIEARLYIETLKKAFAGPNLKTIQGDLRASRQR